MGDISWEELRAHLGVDDDTHLSFKDTVQLFDYTDVPVPEKELREVFEEAGCNPDTTEKAKLKAIFEILTESPDMCDLIQSDGTRTFATPRVQSARLGIGLTPNTDSRRLYNQDSMSSLKIEFTPVHNTRNLRRNFPRIYRGGTEDSGSASGDSFTTPPRKQEAETSSLRRRVQKSLQDRQNLLIPSDCSVSDESRLSPKKERSKLIPLSSSANSENEEKQYSQKKRSATNPISSTSNLLPPKPRSPSRGHTPEGSISPKGRRGKSQPWQSRNPDVNWEAQEYLKRHTEELEKRQYDLVEKNFKMNLENAELKKRLQILERRAKETEDLRREMDKMRKLLIEAKSYRKSLPKSQTRSLPHLPPQPESQPRATPDNALLGTGQNSPDNRFNRIVFNVSSENFGSTDGGDDSGEGKQYTNMYLAAGQDESFVGGSLPASSADSEVHVTNGSEEVSRRIGIPNLDKGFDVDKSPPHLKVPRSSIKSADTSPGNGKSQPIQAHCSCSIM